MTMSSSSEMNEYLWIAVVGTAFGFLYAFGIGANDVANAFASSVASKSITLKQAVIIAGIFEFCGAFFLGARVTGTIRSGIFDIDLYQDEPDIVLLGMFTSIVTSTVMLLVATYYGLPVSTTHTVVGCIIGFSIVARGFDSLEMDKVKQIFISWIISPVCCMLLSFVFFEVIKFTVFKPDEADKVFQRAYYAFPIILTVFVGIDIFFVLHKGLKNLDGFHPKLEWVLPVSFGIGTLCGLVWIFFAGPIVKRRIEIKNLMTAAEKEEQKKKTSDGANALDTNKGGQTEHDSNEDSPTDTEQQLVDIIGTEEENKGPKDQIQPEQQKQEVLTFFGKVSKSFAEKTFKQDLHSQSMHEDERAAKLWEDALVYDGDAEQLFSYVQVFTASLNAFAHGANDVSNAIAPISAIIAIYQTGELSSESPVQKWILAYGGIGIVLGLLLFGYRVMKTIGYKLTPMSPSRGAVSELSGSLFVVVASYMEIPVSSTQCIVGAVAGIGLSGGVKNVQWLMFLKVCVGWVSIFFVSVIFSAALFSMFAFSPSL